MDPEDDEFEKWAKEIGLSYTEDRDDLSFGGPIYVPQNRWEYYFWPLIRWKLSKHWLCWACWQWRLHNLFTKLRGGRYD